MTVVHSFPPPSEGGPYIAGRSAWTTWGHRTGWRTYGFKSLSTQDGQFPVETEDYQVHHAIAGIQSCLNAVGYHHPSRGPIKVTGIFGQTTKWGVQWYQERNGLDDDGIFGRDTAKALFVPLTKWFAGYGGVPAHHLLGMFDLESSFDPGAVSTWYKPASGPDRGIAQINKNAFPAITDAMAFNPMYAIPKAVDWFGASRERYDEKGPELQDVCSIAHHNSPLWASQWYRDGVPPNWQIEAYVSLVLSRAAAYK